MSPSSIVYRMPKHVVLWMCSAVAFAQSSTVPDDHGNDPPTATEVNLGQTAAGAIDPGHDEDYFRLNLPRRATVAVSGTSDDGQGGLCPRAVPRAGSHYLRMSAWPHQDGRTRSYEVFVPETPPDDHGNTEAEATAIMLGGAVAGEIGPNDDVDIFRLQLEQPTTVAVAVAGVVQFGALIDANGEALSELEWVPERSEFQLGGDLDAGTYYVAVGSGEMTERYEIVMREPGLGDR